MAYKGKKGDKLDGEMIALEKENVQIAGGKQQAGKKRLYTEIQPFVLPGLEEERTLIIIRR